MTARYAAAVSEHPVAATAVGEVVGQVLEAVGSAPGLACCFVAQTHTSSMGSITAAVRDLLAPRTLVACSTVSVIGGPQEVEDRPAIALWAGDISGCLPVRLEARRSPDGWGVDGMPTHDLGGAPIDRTQPWVLALMADPATFPAEQLVASLAADWPALVVAGGLASSVPGGSGSKLGLDGAVFVDGAVGVLLPPEVRVRAVVSQGCRPVDQPFAVTKARGNVVLELGGQPALARLEHLVEHATPEERALLAGGVHLGLVIDERRETFDRGDFLVRSVIGAERVTGGIAVGDAVEVGTTVQFQVRDAQTASDDLRLALGGPPADAALVFTCIARGARLFGVHDHDAHAVHDAVGRGAVAGMFCDGELGPVGVRNFVHGYTATVLMFGRGEADR